MGYNTHVVLGILQDPQPEYKEDLAHPYDDGSGYPTLKNENGERILTGRTLHQLEVYASMDLCNTYDSHLQKLVYKYKEKTKEEHSVVFFYDTDGDTRIKEDPYGELLVPIPLQEVLETVQKDVERNDYRRFKWLHNLLESMKDDSEITCVFYGT